jgi:hypothetical protein
VAVNMTLPLTEHLSEHLLRSLPPGCIYFKAPTLIKWCLCSQDQSISSLNSFSGQNKKT